MKYKLIKELLEAENFRGKNCQFIDQEIMAIYLYCLLVRIMMMESAVKHCIPITEVCQQAAFLAVSRFIDKKGLRGQVFAWLLGRASKS